MACCKSAKYRQCYFLPSDEGRLQYIFKVSMLPQSEHGSSQGPYMEDISLEGPSPLPTLSGSRKLCWTRQSTRCFQANLPFSPWYTMDLPWCMVSRTVQTSVVQDNRKAAGGVLKDMLPASRGIRQKTRSFRVAAHVAGFQDLLRHSIAGVWAWYK